MIARPRRRGKPPTFPQLRGEIHGSSNKRDSAATIPNPTRSLAERARRPDPGGRRNAAAGGEREEEQGSEGVT
jgi:hypothetical protein